MDANLVVKAYLKLRDERARIKKEFEAADKELRSKQDRLEAALLKHLEENKTESARTESGTFFRQVKITPTAADWQVVYDYIKDNDAWEMLQKRLTVGFVKTYMDEHDGVPPPGVNTFREYEVRVRVE